MSHFRAKNTENMYLETFSAQRIEGPGHNHKLHVSFKATLCMYYVYCISNQIIVWFQLHQARKLDCPIALGNSEGIPAHLVPMKNRQN